MRRREGIELERTSQKLARFVAKRGEPLYFTFLKKIGDKLWKNLGFLLAAQRASLISKKTMDIRLKTQLAFSRPKSV